MRTLRVTKERLYFEEKKRERTQEPHKKTEQGETER
jgi:hypothetical protein